MRPTSFGQKGRALGRGGRRIGFFRLKDRNRACRSQVSPGLLRRSVTKFCYKEIEYNGVSRLSDGGQIILSLAIKPLPQAHPQAAIVKTLWILQIKWLLIRGASSRT